MPLPSEKQPDLQTYLGQITPTAALPDQVNYWKNTPKFFISMMKSFYGDNAQASNNWGYDWLPKWDRSYDVMVQTELMVEGKMNGYIVQGFNPVAAFSNKNKATEALSKLKYMVIIDPLITETSTFWQNYGEFNDVDTKSIQTEVFRLPSSCFAEENGSIANSGRWLQWHWAAAEPPGEARHDGKILGKLLMRLRELYREEGGTYPDPVMNINWNYKDPEDPTPEEIAREANGMALADVYDDSGKLILKKVSSSPTSHSCVMTAPHPASAGSTLVAGRKLATKWINATMPARVWAARQTGHGAGRKTAAFSTTAPPPTCKVNRGTVNVNYWNGPVRNGKALMCLTLLRPYRRVKTQGRLSCCRKAWRVCSP